uniref:uncharacterized protein LOC112432719 n=1 Tax=Maylandia zebra TaxID=106582 RepID=UPI000D322C4B|nr:uncharacterized protein LOC112432719 [Maylandia zebra]
MEKSVEEQLLNRLEDLGEEELKLFHWYLEKGPGGDFTTIKKSRLENARKDGRHGTVDLMVETYTTRHVMEVAELILKKMNEGKPSAQASSSCLSQEEELARVRSAFVWRVTIEILKLLLEALVSDGILNKLEEESILEGNPLRADKARSLIDTVRKKGDKACKITIKHLQIKDPSLFSQLRLNSDPSAQQDALQKCQPKLKSVLKKKFQCVFEGIAKAGNPTLLN